MTTDKKRDGEYEWVEELQESFGNLVWRWRTEISLAFLLATGLWLSTGSFGQLWGLLVVFSVVGALLATGKTRKLLTNLLYVARVKRYWILAAEDAQLHSPKDLLPTAKRVRMVPVGDELIVRVPKGSSTEEIEKKAEVLASALGAREVKVERLKESAAYALVVIVWHEAFDESVIAWPVDGDKPYSLWQPIPVGVDESGEPVTVSLIERNLLVGGEPGSGKSVAQSLFVAAAALDPSVKLWLFDGKMVELAYWREIAEESVGPDPGQAIEVLKTLKAEMEERYLHLLEVGKRKVEKGDNLPLHVVVVDELAYFMNVSDRKLRSELSDLMRDLVSRGRAAGIIVIAATQKPSHEIIPTALRDLFSFRWAMRCNTWQASDTILGSGWGSLGFSADDIPSYLRGVGYLYAEGEVPAKVKSYYLSDTDIERIAECALRIRKGADGDDDPVQLL